MPIQNENKKTDVQLIVRIDPALRDDFVAACRDQDTTASREVRQFIRDFLGRSTQENSKKVSKGKKVEDEESLICSFCKKDHSEVKRLIGGLNALICDECIELCNEMIIEESEKETNKTC